jgi:hypothetical protein
MLSSAMGSRAVHSCQVFGAMSGAASSLQQTSMRMQLTLEEATRCRREPTPEERAACVAHQKQSSMELTQ